MPTRIGGPAAPPPPLKESDDWLHVKLKDGLTFSWQGHGETASMHLEVPVGKLSGFIGKGKDVAKEVRSAVLTPPLVAQTREVPVQVRNGKLIIDAADIVPAALQLPVMTTLKLSNGHLAMLDVATENVRRDSADLKATSLRENIPVLERIVKDLQGQIADYSTALKLVQAGREVPAELVSRLCLPTDIDGKVPANAVKQALKGTTAQLDNARKMLATQQKELEKIERGDHSDYVDVGRGPGWRPR